MFKTLQEQMLCATIRIEMINDKETSMGSATGFICQKGVNGDNKYYLISNKHVLLISNNLKLYFISKENDIPVFENYIETESFNIEKNIILHKDKEVDLAAVDITDLINVIFKQTFIYAVPYEMLGTFTELELNIASTIFFVGFPVIYDMKNNLPLMRTGIISSHPAFNFNGLPQFVIDAQVFPGSSGSPVFVDLTYEKFKYNNLDLTKREYKLIGVISQTITRGNVIKELPATSTACIAEEIMGLGIVVKSTKIRELLDTQQ